MRCTLCDASAMCLNPPGWVTVQIRQGLGAVVETSYLVFCPKEMRAVMLEAISAKIPLPGDGLSVTTAAAARPSGPLLKPEPKPPKPRKRIPSKKRRT